MSGVITLEGKLDLAAVAELQTQLIALQGAPATLDLRAVTHLGALCLQVMIAAGRGARESDGSLTLINTSDRVLGQMKAMGVCPKTIAAGMQ